MVFGLLDQLDVLLGPEARAGIARLVWDRKRVPEIAANDIEGAPGEDLREHDGDTAGAAAAA